MPLRLQLTDTDATGAPVGQELHATIDTTGPEVRITEMVVRTHDDTDEGVADHFTHIDFLGLIKALGVTTVVSPTPAPTAKKTTAKKTTAKKATAEKTTRKYRKMPEDFADTIRQFGEGAPALMRKYNAPRHTIVGWLRRYRANQPAPVTPEG